MNILCGLFNKKKFIADLQSKESDELNLEQLDSSLELLRSTTAEVSLAAVEAAKVLEERLKDTESRLYGIIDSIDDFVLVKDGHGKWKTMNKFGQSLYGWHNYEYVGKTDEELMELYPEIRYHLADCSESDAQAWENGYPTRSEETVIINGKLQYFDVVKTPVFDELCNRKELIIVGRNITEVKSKNKRVKACFNALNAASDVITICDGHGYIVFCNDKFLQKYGFGDFHDVIGKKMNIISSGKTDNKIYEDLWKTIKSNKTWSGNIVNKTTKGIDVHCKVTIMPVMNGVPEPIYYICTMKHVTRDGQ